MTDHLPLIVVSNHDETYLHFVQSHLVKEGYAVVVTTNNLEAYTRARDVRANAVILDVPIVGIDSTLSTLYLLRLDPQTHRIPILICSTNTALIEHNRAHFVKMQCAILLKPFPMIDLLRQIHEILTHP